MTMNVEFILQHFFLISQIGWGRSDLTRTYSSNSGILREIKVTAVNDSACFRKDPDIAYLAGRPGRTFCAGGENSGACHGDSGSPFLIFSLNRELTVFTS